MYASASVSAAARSAGASAGAEFTACSSISAPFTVETRESAGLSLWVSIWTERAARLYTSHNFWCAAAVSVAVYVGSAVVPAAVAGPLFVGRVSATIKAAAPSKEVGFVVGDAVVAGGGHYYGLGDAGQCVAAAYRFDQGGSEFLDSCCDAGCAVAGECGCVGVGLAEVAVGVVCCGYGGGAQ